LENPSMSHDCEYEPSRSFCYSCGASFRAGERIVERQATVHHLGRAIPSHQVSETVHARCPGEGRKNR
jgi:hypothetical protein